jgi:hypothetical protein
MFTIRVKGFGEKDDKLVIRQAIEPATRKREPTMPIIIEIRPEKNHGLEVYRLYVNGTLLNEFLSLRFAEQKAKLYVAKWDEIKQRKAA